MKDFIGSCLLGALLGAMFAYGVPATHRTPAHVQLCKAPTAG